MINTKENDDGSLIVSADIIFIDAGPEDEKGYYILLDDETGESIGPFESAEAATEEMVSILEKAIGEDGVIDRSSVAMQLIESDDDDE